jgi:glucose-1-phosphate adenylyltransferase
MERVIGIISANYETHDLGCLTQERTIASLPYGGRYRLIDFPLSNMVNSGISTVGLITPYKYRSVIDHIGAGKEWQLDRKNGGLFILPGSLFGVTSSEARFMIRDIKHNLIYLKRSAADYVILTASDVVYNMDYRDLLEQHVNSGADITMLYSEAVEDAPHDLGLEIDGGRVTSFLHGLKKGENIFRGCFVISRELLMNIVSWYSSVDFMDIFEAIEPELGKMDVRTFRFDGYIRTVDSIRDYYIHSMELLRSDVRKELFTPLHPIMTKVQDSVPSKYIEGCCVRNSMIPAGCVIRGTVENSILFRGVKVEEGAVVRNSVLMQSCVVEAGAVVENAILDRKNVIKADTVIKGSPENVFVMEKKTL